MIKCNNKFILLFSRLKIDDSTGCINVTLWKNLIFDENSLDHSVTSNSYEKQVNMNQFNDVYTILGSMKKLIKEKQINNSIMYEPKQGDLVVIRAQTSCFKQTVNLNAISCVRVSDSTDELIQMMLPSILDKKVYSSKGTSEDKFNELKAENKNEELNTKKVDNPERESIKDMECFLAFVNKKLQQITTKSADLTVNTKSCNSFSLYTFLSRNCPIEFKFVTHKQVLDALKELELRGLVYSCEDESHYLPIN